MNRGVPIKKITKQPYPLEKYLEPKQIFIPLIANKDDDITVLVKKDDYVFEGDMVAKSKGDLRIPIHSSVSGRVLGFDEMSYLNNEKVKCLVIQNDFVDKLDNQEYSLNSYSKEEVVNRMKENGVVGLSGTAFPAYVKYNNEIKTLIVNAVETDPEATTDAILVKEKCEELLEVVDALVEIYGMNEGIIAVRKNDYSTQRVINDYIGTYIKLKMVEVPNVYTAGWECELVHYVKKVSYKNYPTEKGIVVSSVATIYAIYECLKYNKPLTQRVVTFSGDKLARTANVLVKIGTPVRDIITILGGTLDGDKMLIANGSLMGTSIASDDLVISSDLTSVSVISALAEPEEKTCLRCGECVLVCPVKLSPVLIKEATENIKDYRPHKCIGCGLCSYICPAMINLRRRVERAKEDVS